MRLEVLLANKAKFVPIYLDKLSGLCKAGSRSYVTAEPAVIEIAPKRRRV